MTQFWALRRVLFSCVCLGLLVLSGCQTPPPLPPESSPIIEEKTALASQEEPLLTVSFKNQEQVGITIKPVFSGSLPQMYTATGLLMSLPDVSDLKSRYVTAYADLKRSQATLKSSQAALKKLQSNAHVLKLEYERSKILNADKKNISDKVLEAAQGAYQSAEADVAGGHSVIQLDHANAEAAQMTIQAVKEATTQRVGPVVAEWVMASSPEYYRLIARRDVLIQMTIPSDMPVGKMPNNLTFETPSGVSVIARYVSPALQADQRVQGESAYYIASIEATGLIPGATVTASIAQKSSVSGVLVPSSAVVWWSGKPWVYVAKDKTHFYRKQLIDYSSEQKQWFVKSGLSSGTVIVTKGASLLLSQEFQDQFSDNGE